MTPDHDRAARMRDKFDRPLPALKAVERNSLINGVADLRSAIQRATIARQRFNAFNAPVAKYFGTATFGELEAAYLDTASDARDALGALGLGPGEINALGEVLS